MKQRKGWRKSCDVGGVTERSENELCSAHSLTFVTSSTSQLILQYTGAQEWHIVSLVGDVTYLTTAVHYVSMKSDLCVLSTEKHCPVRRQRTVYTEFTVKGEVHSSPLNK